MTNPSAVLAAVMAGGRAGTRRPGRIRFGRLLVAITAGALMVWFASSPAHAHGPIGIFQFQHGNQNGPLRVDFRVRLIYANDTDPVTRGATVTVKGIGPEGAALPATPLTYTGTDGYYETTITFPVTGSWTMTFLSENPAADYLHQQEVSGPPPTIPPPTIPPTSPPPTSPPPTSPTPTSPPPITPTTSQPTSTTTPGPLAAPGTTSPPPGSSVPDGTGGSTSTESPYADTSAPISSSTTVGSGTGGPTSSIPAPVVITDGGTRSGGLPWLPIGLGAGAALALLGATVFVAGRNPDDGPGGTEYATGIIEPTDRGPSTSPPDSPASPPEPNS